MTISIETDRMSPRWPQDAEALSRLAERASTAVSAHLGSSVQGGLAAVCFSDDAHLADLNERFRQKSGPTNVLSFPAPAAPEGLGDPLFLGDIAIAYETLHREAEAAAKPLDHHLTHLLIHGVLHLLGYDHEEAAAAEEMEALETRILASLDIPDPYALKQESEQLTAVRPGD